MIAQLKQKYIQYKIRKTGIDWFGDNRIKVLIRLNQHFGQVLWQNFFDKYQVNDQKYQIKFANNKYETLKLFKQADRTFLFGVSRYLDFTAKPSKILYLPFIGLDEIKQNKIPQETKLLHPRGITSNMIAEYVHTMILFTRNNFHIAVKNMARKKWKQKQLLTDYNTQCKKHVAGILGFGNNGKAIASRLLEQDMKVWVTDIKKPDKNLESLEFVSPENIENKLRETDFLVLALPLTNKTRGMVDKNFLETLKNDTTLINVSRGEIIMEKDLINHLKQFHTFKAVLDVFSKEPLPRNSRLWRMSNVLITPHIAGNINRMKNEICKDFYTKCLAE